MKRLILFTTLALAVLMAIPALAADAPELRGTWKGKSFVNTNNGFKEGQAAFVIDDQAGPLFKGYKLYFNAKNILEKEMFTGIYGDDSNLYFAENADGYTFGQLTGKQTMSAYYLEHGATNKSILYRLQRIHFTSGFMQIDRDGDKAVVTAEITSYYPLNAKRIMEEADTNKDGKLTKEEWETWQKSH
ncbi:calcium-binding protein [Pseudodesulfovibrio sp.]|uniref:calcium-binding protein n=1 Tax=unclassified Pseudodesulfovibrio TaxID=2661612 RepID=UPI003AFFA9BC